MPWWAWLWAALMVIVAAAGLWDDLKSGVGGRLALAWYLGGLICPVLAFAFFTVPEAFYLRGGWLLAGSMLAAVSLAGEASKDIRNLRNDEGGESVAIVLAASLTIATYLPAIALGAVAGWRTL